MVERRSRVLTVVISKQRPVELSRLLSSLLGRSDVVVISQDSDLDWGYWIKMFDLVGNRLFVKMNESNRLCDRNEGIKVARDLGYEYVFFVDDDNIVPAGYLEDLVKYLDFNRDVVGVSGYIQTYGNTRHYRHYTDGYGWIYNKDYGQRVYVDDEGNLVFTEKVQVLGVSTNTPIRVDYFVNSWLQRNVDLWFDCDFSVLGEEVDYTYRLGKLGKLMVLPNKVMFHLRAKSGGTRDMKRSVDEEKLQFYGLFAKKNFGVEIKGIKHTPVRID